VNETTDKNFLRRDAGSGCLVLRGANVCMYVLRDEAERLTMWRRRAPYSRRRFVRSPPCGFRGHDGKKQTRADR
jgi:hypothetical protein